MKAIEHLVRRVLLTLETSCCDTGVIRESVRVAGRLKVDLCGLFVEDTALLAVARLPFTVQLNTITGQPRPLEFPDLEQQLTIAAVQARRRLSGLAERDQVRWTFETVRERRAAALEARVKRDDLVIMTMGRGPLSYGHEGGFRLPAGTASVSALLPPSPATAATGVAVICDSPEHIQRQLSLGARLAGDRPVWVVVSQTIARERMAACEHACARLREAGTEASMVLLGRSGPQLLPTLLRRQRPAVLVLASVSPFLSESGLLYTAANIGCITMVVR
jgi:hypothetical protein